MPPTEMDSMFQTLSTYQEHNPGAPIVFKRSWGKPNMRIQVFGQEFYVHSLVMQNRAEYFKVFIDAADQDPAARPSLGEDIQYDYVSVVDPDGQWGLEPARKISRTPITRLRSEEDERTEQEAVYCMISAIYGNLYEIADLNVFRRLTALADFYRATTVVSSSVDSCFHGSLAILEGVHLSSPCVIANAKKLQCPILFKEAYAFAVGSWGAGMRGMWESSDAYDREVVDLVEQGYIKLLEMKNNANEAIIHACYGPRTPMAVFELISGCGINRANDGMDVNFYRELIAKLCTFNPVKEADRYNEAAAMRLTCMKDRVLPLLADHTLTSDREIIDDRWDLKTDFLCITVSNEELPWNKRS
ncbi:hypothetical protein PVAG01_02066 [Phlyctema vagabunda]|uniref:BTB domain-containing protein n=1 Tax=Phlyctema vagabunda TaxID=108571 RepID=A0ABR4PPH0_9HELO